MPGQVREVGAAEEQSGLWSRKGCCAYSQQPLAGRVTAVEKTSGFWFLLPVALLRLRAPENNHFGKYSSIQKGFEREGIAIQSVPDLKLLSDLYLPSIRPSFSQTLFQCKIWCLLFFEVFLPRSVVYVA